MSYAYRHERCIFDKYGIMSGFPDMMSPFPDTMSPNGDVRYFIKFYPLTSNETIRLNVIDERGRDFGKGGKGDAFSTPFSARVLK